MCLILSISGGQKHSWHDKKRVPDEEKTDFIIEPFIGYWNIDKSDVVPGFYEPENETLEYGIQLIWRF